ncbi:MAG: FHA domain-containing protein [Deltaproteobacteria bacterium]|nr:FHA domain-containing protein [Deltaproteobacteria bacterium]
MLKRQANILNKLALAIAALALFSSFAMAQGDTPEALASLSVKRLIFARAILISQANLLPEEVTLELSQKGWSLDGSGGIYFNYEDIKYQGSLMGSTYLVSDGWWVTCAHVVKLKEERQEIFIVANFIPQLEVYRARLDWKNDLQDLALLKTESIGHLTPLTLAKAQYISPPLEVSAIGYPQRDNWQAGPTINAGNLIKATKEGEVGMWEHTTATSEGMSGGPLINHCGEVVGTIARGAVAQDANLALTTGVLLAQLDNKNIPCNKADDHCQSSPQENTSNGEDTSKVEEEGGSSFLRVLYVGVILVTLAIIILVIYLLRLRKMLKTGQHIKATETVVGQKILSTLIGKKPGKTLKEGDITWKLAPDDRWMRYDPITGVVYRDELIEEKEDTTRLPDGQEKAPEQREGNYAILHSTDLGDIFAAEGDKLIVGSMKPPADVRLEADFISKKHLKITNLNGRILIEDLGSTNGTFINNNRIQKEVTLNPGDVLRLGAVPGVAEFHLMMSSGSLVKLKSSTGEPVTLSSNSFTPLTLFPGQELTIGSSKLNSQVVLMAPFISRAHMRVTNINGRVLVEDLGSTNGTFINNLRLLAPQFLNAGDILRLGKQPGFAEYRIGPEVASRGSSTFVVAVEPQFLNARSIGVAVNSTITIGYLEKNSLVIRDKIISGSHCSLSVLPDRRLLLKDLGSTNGTYIGGSKERIKEEFVTIGQSFYLANPVYTYKLMAI